MKTSVLEVQDMLSALNVDGVEKRIGEVPGVESFTVNYAAGSATVRYDETRLQVADIKSAVRQNGYEPAASSVSAGDAHQAHNAEAVPAAMSEKSAPAAIKATNESKTPPLAPTIAPAVTPSAVSKPATPSIPAVPVSALPVGAEPPAKKAPRQG